MKQTEQTELTVLCLIHTEDSFLLQNRIKKDWQGYTLPGGHLEPGESIVDAVIRETKEETGLTIISPRLCGIKQFPLKDGDYRSGRYLVFLFECNEFSGVLRSSEEGEMYWIKKDALDSVPLVEDFHELLTVMQSPRLSEFQYIIQDNNWTIIQK